MSEHIKIMLENTLGYGWFVFLAIWGGTASYLGRLKKLKSSFSITELIGEWTISGFAGIITAYFCMHFELSFFLTASLTGMSGHMGGRAIYIVETFLEKRAKQHLR